MPYKESDFNKLLLGRQMTKKQEVKLFIAGLLAMIDEEAKKNPLTPSVDEVLQGVSTVEYAVDKLNKKEEKR